MEKFSLYKWVQKRNLKVVTRTGIEAKIIHDCHPLVAIINGVAYNFDEDGNFQSNKSCHNYDLFFSNDEKELNEFEEELYKSYMCIDVVRENYNKKEVESFVKTDATNLIEIARKEVWKTLPKWKQAKKEIMFEKYVLVIKYSGEIIMSNIVLEDEYYIELDDFLRLPIEE